MLLISAVTETNPFSYRIQFYLFIFYFNVKLELLTQFPALNDEN